MTNGMNWPPWPTSRTEPFCVLKNCVPGPGPAGIWTLATGTKQSSSVSAVLHKAMDILLAAKSCILSLYNVLAELVCPYFS
jgi:hypothetical protein